MSVAHTDAELEEYLAVATRLSSDHPVVVSKFVINAKEIEVDAVAKNGELICHAISEHVENAGVHSGDATLVFPPQRLYVETLRRVRHITQAIAKALRITGPFNIQFLASRNAVMVIECNLRASRSLPFVSKILKENLVDLAVRAMLGHPVESIVKSSLELNYVGVKAPQFSFSRLPGADPLLGVEMASTGEVGCLGDSLHEAYLKALMAVGLQLPRKGALLSTGTLEGKLGFLAAAKALRAMGLTLYATSGTRDFLLHRGVETTLLHWPLDKTSPNAIELLEAGEIDLVVNVPKNFGREETTNNYLIRRKAADLDIPVFANIQAATLFVEALRAAGGPNGLSVKAWREYS